MLFKLENVDTFEDDLCYFIKYLRFSNIFSVKKKPSATFKCAYIQCPWLISNTRPFELPALLITSTNILTLKIEVWHDSVTMTQTELIRGRGVI